MQDMLGALEQFIQLDVPFLKEKALVFERT